MIAILEGLFWIAILILDIAIFIAEVLALPSVLRDAMKDPLRSVLWLISALGAGMALAVWEERVHLWLAAGLTLCAVGGCALALALPRLRRRGLGRSRG